MIFFQDLDENNVTVFGSARLKLEHPVYQDAVEFAKQLGMNDIAVITGGGPGIMEAANKGAFLAGVKSIGINIQLPFEQRVNKYVTVSSAYYYFFTRKAALARAYKGYVFFWDPDRVCEAPQAALQGCCF